MLLARALHLTHTPVRVVSLRRLVLAVEHETELLTECRDATALFVLEMQQSYGRAASAPLTGWQIMGVEDFLCERLRDGDAVFVHATSPLTPPSEWWSHTFLATLADLNEVVEVRA
jgi:hypothetical protein